MLIPERPLGKRRLERLHSTGMERSARRRRASGTTVVGVIGDSHKPRVEHRSGLLLLNPGSAGPRRFSLPIAVARLSLRRSGARAEIVELRRGLDGAKVRGAVSPP